ncbi:unnamed protein product, partial [Rotaria socialis]
MKCMDNWPPEYRTPSGQERAHDYLLKSIMGVQYDPTRISCGGFFYIHGELVYNCTWLNMRDQQGARSDGKKALSHPEKLLVDYCFNQYKEYGKHHVFQISSALDEALLSETQSSS